MMIVRNARVSLIWLAQTTGRANFDAFLTVTPPLLTTRYSLPRAEFTVNLYALPQRNGLTRYRFGNLKYQLNRGGSDVILLSGAANAISIPLQNWL